MNCFFRIWRTHSFSCLDPSNKLVTLPLSVQAEVRHIARKALESLEHDVFKQLDECVAHQGPPKTQEKLAIWASMWQLMLMYRDLLNAFKADISRMGPVHDPAVGMNSLTCLKKYGVLISSNSSRKIPLSMDDRQSLPTSGYLLSLPV